MHFNRSLLAISIGCALAASASAEVVFSSGAPTLTGNMIIDATAGVTQGANLLHSFSAFNVQTGESANFTGPAAIDNIIARVTGTQASTINGMLKSSIVSANLFLLNPNGIVFGAGAQIDVDGGLYLTTANSMLFDDGSQLLVSDSGASGFTAAPPSAFGFAVTPADISFANVSITTAETSPGVFAAAPVDKFTVIGGNLLLDKSSIVLRNTDFDLVALAGPGTVALAGARLPASDQTLGTVTINGSSVAGVPSISASGDPAGKVSVLANTLTMTGAVNPITNSNEGGTIFSDNSGAIKGKGIAIALSGNLHLDTGSRITTDASGSGEGGDLAILADAVALQDQNTKISSDTRSPTGSSGALEITANSILVENSASISATTLGAASTNALSINTGSLTLSSGSSIAGQTAGTGTSTTININASGSVLVTGSGSEISSSTFSFDGADAGKINITAGDVSVLDEGSIQSESSFFFFGAPGSVAVTTDRLVVSSLGTISTLNASAISAGGDVTIDAKSVLVTGTDPVTQRDSSITSSASSDAAGGNVVIRTDTIDVTAGGRVEALTQQDGAAGTISITGNLQVDGGFIDARTLGTGAGGSIVLAGDISVSNGGRIDTSTPEDNFGAGNAGQLSISGASLVVSGSGSAVASSTQSDGAAGSVAISSASVSVTNGGTITTSTTSVKPTAGDAGDISLASKSVSVSGAGSTIASSTAGPAVGGNIAISGTDLTIAGKGRVTVTATGAGNAGNISLIASNTLDVLDAGNVETNAALSGGGSINIDVVNRIYLRDSTITASSGGPEVGADGGNITIDPIFFILDNSRIVAQAVAGNGGIINLYADNFIRDINSTISASSQLGNDGEVTITSPDNAVAGVIGALATGLASEEVLLSEPCAARVLENRSSLVVVKASHGYAAPDDYLSGPTVNCRQ